METHQKLAKNLSLARSLRCMTLSEFSQELGIPKSTLQSILKSGNTTVHTLSRISRRLNISASALMGDELSDDFFQPLMALLPLLGWFSNLNVQQQASVSSYLFRILEVLQNE